MSDEIKPSNEPSVSEGKSAQSIINNVFGGSGNSFSRGGLSVSAPDNTVLNKVQRDAVMSAIWARTPEDERISTGFHRKIVVPNPDGGEPNAKRLVAL
ncbi:hypothetical protein I3271_07495 [Photobacterium leiognathi]|uniref:hypothetical protein n=1 Tax=Photobacterium leiognathi TaxID=553611 RepID=UPI001EDEECA2|nr:hypothetical protein [Photobacterium leiognathi]MCG3884530.1 hypothetical protein [Photobacterium leiognathi]